MDGMREEDKQGISRDGVREGGCKMREGRMLLDDLCRGLSGGDDGPAVDSASLI
jgi:hypothetical protein